MIATNYTRAYIFTKHTNLLQWFDKKYSRELNLESCRRSAGFNQLRQHYATPRDVQLMLLCRFDGDKIYCKIRCPINPLPIRGEFEVSSIRDITQFLNSNGWVLKDQLFTAMFK